VSVRAGASRLFALILLVSTAVPVPSASAADDLIVHTQNGDVAGIATATADEWRGIPYAAPPVGDLRWRPPAPVEPWEGVRDASEFAAPCLQLRFGPQGIEGTTGRERCLFLNVFAPSDATAASGFPVMVHLHPGSNYFGEAYQNPSAFVARDVVVVTLAYRLGILGFGGHKLLTAEGGGSSGEYGLLDQLAALGWVQDNIAAFGGDPSNVTLFGSSSGSFDAVALMASPLSTGLFARVAVQGEEFQALTGKRARIHYAEVTGRHAAAVSGCDSDPDVIACLRALPARQLVRQEGPGYASPLVGGVVLPRSPLRLLEEASSSVPLLVGFDREEDRFVLPFPLPDPFTRRMWLGNTLDLIGQELLDEARALYPPSAYGSRAWSFVTMRTDAVRGCPTRRLANAVSEIAPTWRWLYTHVYENDPLLADGRASHLFEEPFLWGDFGMLGSFGFDAYTPTPGEQLLSQRMTDYWTNFATTGDPNGPGLPVWPAYDTVTEPALVLDDPIGVQSGYHVTECALLDTLAVPYP
jgi:para-nitrobenzyl esterase